MTTLMEYYFEGQKLSDYERKRKEQALLEEYMNNLEDNRDVIQEALEYLLTEMGNGDILRAHDEAFKNRGRR